jgi:cytochrome bd ubiquinol oxidase subunit II
MLESIWFVLWGVLWAVYFMLDGFDLGLGALMPVLARNEDERRTVYRAMGPFWDGNEVWLITAGGVTFAAFPVTYAVMFSGLYSALMLVLFALIFRGIALEYRSHMDDARWRKLWDTCLVGGSFAAAVLLGVAFANIFQGIPIDGEGVFQGDLFTLLNPYGLFGGVLFLLMFLLHGSLWLILKSEGDLQTRTAQLAEKLWIALAVAAVGFLVATWFATRLYDNYLKNPFFFAVPIVLIPTITVAALVLIRVSIAKERWWSAWFSSSAFIVGVTLFGVAGLYPNLLPSSLNPDFSLNVTNSSSSPLTLKIMLVVALIFVPVVLVYQTWAYRLFKDRLEDGEATHDEAY